MKKSHINSEMEDGNESSMDSISKKRTDFILDKLKEKKDEIEGPIYDFLENSFERIKQPKKIPKPSPTTDPKSQRRIDIILDRINKKRADNEIDDGVMDLLKKSIGQNISRKK